MIKSDQDIRCELSALYRILHMYGMTDLANQCAGARSAEDRDCSFVHPYGCLLYTSPSPRDRTRSRMPSSA